MNDDPLLSILREADKAAGEPPMISSDLAVRVRNEYTRRSIRRARFNFVIACCACYLGGVLTTHIWSNSVTSHSQELDSSELALERAIDPQDSVTSTETPAVAARVADASQQTHGVAIKSSYDLYRELGNASHRNHNLEAAIRYYRVALDAASAKELEASFEEDNWLLASLKRDRITVNQRRS